jgi:hypothetical protein
MRWPPGNRVRRMAQTLGAASCAGLVALWIVFLFLNPYSRSGLTIASYFMGGVMGSAAVAGIYAFLHPRPPLLYLIFIVSFFPVGLYFLLSPGVFRLVGYLNIAQLIATVVLHADVRRATVSVGA